MALKHAEVRAGTRVFDRPFGVLEIHSASLFDVRRVGEAILTGTGKRR